MLKLTIKKWRLKFVFLQEDLRKLGLICIGVGCAGIFLDFYPKLTISYLFLVAMTGIVIWLLGLIERNPHDDHY
jgi:hypothetical protein